MMGAEKTLVNVNKGQDAYSVIGNYISNHVTAIEDMIAVIQINGVIINELYMVDVDVNGYFYWESDWWEGEEDVALLDFFPVSDAERIKWISCSERLPLAEYGESDNVLATCGYRDGEDTSIRWIKTLYFNGGCWCYPTGEIYDQKVYAWMPLPEPYRAERRTDEQN